MSAPVECAPGSRAPGRASLALIAAILTAFALRVWLLGDQNIWWDEGLAIWAVRQGWARMTLWTASDVHPPLYFWLLHSWVGLAGESEFAARFISLICGVVTVAGLYALGKALFGQQVALTGTTLLAMSRFHVWWSQEMRMYIVATMWGVFSLYAFIRWMQAEGWMPRSPPHNGPRHRMLFASLYVLTTAAGLYTLYLFVTIVVIESLFVLGRLLGQLRQERRRLLGRWAISQAAVLAIFGPWLAIALPRMRSWSVAEPFDLTLFVRLYATLLTLGISTYIERYTWLVLPFLAILVAAALLTWRGRSAQRDATRATQARLATMLLFLFLLIPPFLVYALTRPRGLFYAPKVEARYLVMFAPAFALLLAWGLVVLWRRARLIAAAALAFVLAAFIWTLPAHYGGRYLRDEHQTMVRIIAAYAQPGDAVLLVSGSRYPIFGYYYGRLPSGPARPPVYELPQTAPQISQSNVEGQLAPIAASHVRLWLAEVNAPMQDPEGLVENWLGQRYTRVLSHEFAHNALSLFASEGATLCVDPKNLAPQHPLSAPLDRASRLLGYDLPTSEFRPDDTIHLALYYVSPKGVNVVVCLEDERGRILEQRESHLNPADPIGRHPIDWPVYGYTPAGSYVFEIEAADGSNTPLHFGSLRIAATHPLPKATQAPVALSVFFADGIELLGYGLTDAAGQPVSEVRPGELLVLDLYWTPHQKTAYDYTVFAHLVGQSFNPATGGPVWAGHDSQPLGGGYPTTQWFIDETVVDRHSLQVDAATPVGDYELEVGLYRLETMERLVVLDAEGQAVDNRVVLGHFAVVHP